MTTRIAARTLSPALLLCAAAFASPAAAQSAVREVPRPSTPFVPLYSTCRATPPDDAVAQALFKAMWPLRSFADDQRLLDALRAKPVDQLSAAEAEAYFLLLRQLEMQVLLAERASGPPERRWAVVLDGRTQGLAIAQRFHGDSFVRCAFLGAEAWILNRPALRDRFSAQQRSQARDDYLAFLESALRGEVRTDSSATELHAVAGQLALDSGFDLLPDAAHAAPLFEAGARHLLDAASGAQDGRGASNWQRYAFMLHKLPPAQQLAIAQRLLAHVEGAWGGKSARSAAALDVYLHLLDVAGESALAARSAKDAVSIYTRHLAVVQVLRQRDPQDANHQVSEVLAQLLLGDAQQLAGDASAAAQAYREAGRLHASANAAARDMLQAQDFAQELASRQRGLR